MSSANPIPPPIVRGQELLALVFNSSYRLGDRSNFDGIVQRAISNGIPTVRCRRCGGSTWGNQPAINRWERERKQWETEHPGMTYSRVVPCPIPQGECGRCNGTGFHLGKTDSLDITAKPTGGSMDAGGRSAPDDSVMRQVAQASRVMLRVEKANLEHWRALQAYHGVVGEYAEGKHGNRLLAVVVLLPRTHEMLLEAELIKLVRKAQERADKVREQALKRKDLRWTFSDGTVVHRGGRVVGQSPLAQSIAQAISRCEPALLDDPAALDTWLRGHLRWGWVWRQVRMTSPAVLRQPPPTLDVDDPTGNARSAIALLHSMSTRMHSDAAALLETIHQEAYELLCAASRTWEACLEQ